MSESYLDTGNRAAFANGGTSVMAQPDFAMRVWESESCAPLVTGGLDLEAQQHALLARASEMGHARTDDAAPVLIVNGIELRPARYGARLVFKLPVGAVRGVLASRTYVPAQLEPGSTDRRRLGVAVVAMVLDRQPIDLAGPMQGTGWHAPEAKLRWTDGAATIDLAGCARLTLTLATWGQYWCDPTPRSTVDTHAA